MQTHQPIAWNFATSGSNNVHAYKNTILAPSDDLTNARLPSISLSKLIRSSCLSLPLGLPVQHVRNSVRRTKFRLTKICRDGFSAGGTNLLFEDNYVVNGDDCLTVGDGAVNITFRNTYCKLFLSSTSAVLTSTFTRRRRPRTLDWLSWKRRRCRKCPECAVSHGG